MYVSFLLAFITPIRVRRVGHPSFSLFKMYGDQYHITRYINLLASHDFISVLSLCGQGIGEETFDLDHALIHYFIEVELTNSSHVSQAPADAAELQHVPSKFPPLLAGTTCLHSSILLRAAQESHHVTSK